MFGLAAGWSGATAARELAAVESRGTVVLCAHANALPFSSRHGDREGFQIDIARELARGLGVSLDVQWVVSPNQFRSADCDIVLDAIVDPEALDDLRLKPSIPYQRSGVALVLPAASDGTITGFADLRPGQRVAVQVGSLAAMLLERRGIRTIPFGFEDEMIDAVQAGEVEAAAVSPATAGWYNRTHPDRAVR